MQTEEETSFEETPRLKQNNETCLKADANCKYNKDVDHIRRSGRKGDVT